jgi:hypothetical protein
VLEKWKWPYWEKVQNFKVRDHFVEHNEEMDEKSMQEFISKELSVRMFMFWLQFEGVKAATDTASGSDLRHAAFVQ